MNEPHPLKKIEPCLRCALCERALLVPEPTFIPEIFTEGCVLHSFHYHFHMPEEENGEPRAPIEIVHL